MNTSFKRGWYVVYLPALISLPLFLMVALVNEINIKENAKNQIIEELQYKIEYIEKALHYVVEQQESPLKTDQYDTFIDALGSNSQTHISLYSTQGVLLADSFSSGHTLTSSPRNTELVDTLASTANVVHYNPLIGQSMRYISSNHASFILRVGLSTNAEQKLIIEHRYDYAPSFILMFFLTSVGGFYFISSINNRLKIRYQNLKQRVHTQTAELLLLQEFGTLLTLSKSLSDIEQVLAKFAQMLMYHDAGVISVIRSSRNLAEIKVGWGEQDWFEAGSYTLDACWSLRKGYAHPQGPYDKLIRCDHDSGPISNLICIPLVSQGETLGVMHFRRNNLEDEYDENDRKIATSIAEQVALSIANLQLRDNLRNQAIKDSLTGLFNRRYFAETAEKELARANKTQSMMAILMIDLDFFKKLNDNFGHDVGDKVLSEFGSLLNSLTHKEHIACRMGGEEFVVLLSDTNIDAVRTFSETLLQQLRNLKVTSNGTSVGTVTASVGVSIYPECANEISELVKLADQALYQAKSQGRDRTVFSSPYNSEALELASSPSLLTD